MKSHGSTFSSETARLHSACACASAGRFSPPGTARKYERQRPFQIRHLALDLELDFPAKAVSGTATLDIERRAEGGTELRLDAVAFELGELELHAGKKKPTILSFGDDYSYDGDEIVVSLPASFQSGSLTIRYRATPRLGLYFLAPDKEVPDRPRQVWSQCQDEDGRHWFPCQDKPHVKMTYEMRVQVPHGMTVLSGGELLESSRPARGNWAFHFRLDVPTSAYLVTLVVGDFDEWTESLTLPSGKVVPLRYMVPRGKIADGKRAFHRTKEAIALFSERTGVEYPFGSYTQVVVSDFIFGGMENTTATTMYEHILFDKTAAIDIESHDLVAHELAHQWFGDLVTCRDWSHAWLNEGFATYFEHVEREHRLGLDEYEHNVTSDLNVYLGEARGSYERAIVCRDYDEPIDLFDRHLYQKGGLVLHMLRRRVGDAAFFLGVKNYLTQHRSGLVETNDLMRTVEEASGIGLEKFFDQWVYRPGHPELKVKVSFTAGTLTVDVEQTQKGVDPTIFEIPFEIDVTVGNQTTRHVRLINERTSSLVVQSTQRPRMVTIDPRYLLTAPIALSAPSDMLRNAVSEAPRARARRMAAQALSRRHDPDTVTALAKCLSNDEETWMVREKAAESLSKIRGEVAERALLDGVGIADPKVRKAVAGALSALRSLEATAALVKLTSDKSYLVSAAAARSLAHVKDEATKKLLKSLLKRESWADVVRSAALASLAESGDDAMLPLLLEWTQYGKPLRSRRAAIAALPRLGEGKVVRDHLVELLHDRDPHLRKSVLAALLALGDEKSRGPISQLLEREQDGGVRTKAKHTLSELGKTGVSGLKEAKDETEKLKRELDDLKLRLLRLEQQSSADKKPASKLARQAPASNPTKTPPAGKKPARKRS